MVCPILLVVSLLRYPRGILSKINRTVEPPVSYHPGGGTPIHYLYGYVPPKGVVILTLLI